MLILSETTKAITLHFLHKYLKCITAVPVIEVFRIAFKKGHENELVPSLS